VIFTLLFLLTFSGTTIGMFISILSKSRLQANQAFLLVFIVLLLSLMFVADPNFTNWHPMYQSVSGFTSAAYKGFGFSEKPWPFISLLTIGSTFFGLTVVAFHFKKRIE
ncbi:MAG: hypothetical protein ACTSWN_02345, partial [Promethearchaeota archaeon]